MRKNANLQNWTVILVTAPAKLVLMLIDDLELLIGTIGTAPAPAAAGGGCGPNPWLAFTSHTSRSSCHFFTSFGVGGPHFNHHVKYCKQQNRISINRHWLASICIQFSKRKTVYTGANGQNLNGQSENSKCLCNIIGRHGVKSSCRTYQTQQYALIMTQSLSLNWLLNFGLFYFLIIIIMSSSQVTMVLIVGRSSQPPFLSISFAIHFLAAVKLLRPSSCGTRCTVFCKVLQCYALFYFSKCISVKCN